MRRQQIILRLAKEEKELTSLANLTIDGNIDIKLWHISGKADHLSFISEQQILDELVAMPKETTPIISSFYDFKSLSIKRFNYIEDGAPFSRISFSDFPCLAELNLINLNIQKIPEDTGLLQSLEKLDLSGNDFKNLPTSMKNLYKLKDAKLSNCTKLEALPELTKLQALNVSGCSNLKSLVEVSHTSLDIGRYCLLELDLDNCKKVQRLSGQLSHFTKLTQLNLSSHDFKTIPASIKHLGSLGTLCLNNCKNLKSVEELPMSLEHLYAHGCDSLENVTLPQNNSIKHLDLSHCFSLQHYGILINQFLNDRCSQEVSHRFLCLPGNRMPKYFDNRSSGTSTKITLPPIMITNTHVDFAACIMISCERSLYLQFPTFSYDWNYEKDEVVQINLKPNLYYASEIEEDETVEPHHLVIIHVPSSIKSERIEDLRLETHLQLPEEIQFPPGEIRICGCGICIIADVEFV